MGGTRQTGAPASAAAAQRTWRVCRVAVLLATASAVAVGVAATAPRPVAATATVASASSSPYLDGRLPARISLPPGFFPKALSLGGTQTFTLPPW